MNTDDSILLRRWLSERDADAFVQVAMRHAKMVYNTALRILGNPHDAEEVAQDCFEALASTTKPPKDNLSGWLYQVAANQAKNRIRSEQRRQDREEKYWAELPPILDVSWDNVYQYVDEIILELPDICREPLVAHFFEHETHQQIAQRLGIPRRTVTNHIQQGIESIRQGLKKRGIPVTAAAIGTWFEAQATAVTTLPAPLAAKIARIGIAGVGEAAVTSGSISFLGKTGALLSTKWVLGGIAVALVLGSTLFLASKTPQTPVPVSVSSTPVTSEIEKVPTTLPVVDPPKMAETPPATATTPATTSIVEDPLASLWGFWSTEVKMGDQPPRQGSSTRIHQEGNNIVISTESYKESELIGPIHGLQLQMSMKISASGNMTLSGTYTPNADLFTLSGSFSGGDPSVPEGKSVPMVLIFTRLKGNAVKAELRKAEIQAISSALEEYKKDFGGMYPARLEEVAQLIKGDAVILTSSPERKIIYTPKVRTKPEMFFSEDMLQWDSNVQYSDQIVAAEAHMHEIGLYDYFFYPPLVTIEYKNPTQRISASSSGRYVVIDGDDTQFFDSCENNLKQLGIVEKMFAEDHHGFISGGWAMVYPEYMSDSAILSCPARPAGEDSYELLFPAVSTDNFCSELFLKVTKGNADVATAQRMVPMVVERSTHTLNGKQGRNVLFFDGHVEFVAMSDLPTKVERFIKANK